MTEPYRLGHVPRRHRRILLALLSGAGNLSGYPLSRVAQVSSGTVYVVLARLEAAGWAAGEWDPEQTPDGGRRRYYHLTLRGRQQAMRLLGLEDPPPPGTRLADLPGQEA